ncbi:unnamed protein product [Cyclocybe aegerita]|uniref:F-box domain-containing protein n=1 Tax=Cyclocybe aegerita TaxID=1973307 RepID=A0A8S0XQI1_CYCAE|nr:unnamed protein product [Cyclocybe aegerita]
MSYSLSPLLTQSLSWTGISRPTRRRIAGRPPVRSVPLSPTQGAPRNAVVSPRARQTNNSTVALDVFGRPSDSHVGVLPDEIIAIIVDYAYPRTEPFAVIRYAHVCQRWRAIVFSTPSLWTNVALPPHISDETEILRCVSEWIQRAGALPFRLTIDTIAMNRRTSLDVMRSLSTSLLMERCAHLALEPKFFDSIYPHVACLEILPNYAESPRPRIIVPSVPSVSISSSHALSNFDFPSSSSSISIRTLSLSAPGYTTSFLPLLLACPYIEECTIAYDESPWFNEENEWVVNTNVAQEERSWMPRLKKLTVVRPPRNALKFMSKAVCAPELDVVEVLLRDSKGVDGTDSEEVERDVDGLCEAERKERKVVKVVYLTKEEWGLDARNNDHKMRRGWDV